MTPEDRDAIVGFFDRMKQLTTERDPDAERLIAELMQHHPQTRYYITQMAFFLEHAMAEAQNRIRELEHELQQKSAGGLLGGLFGGGRPAPPAPTHAPGYRPGMFQQPGGFLGGAARTAAGIAGGMVLGSLLASMFAPASEAHELPPDEEPDDSSFEVDEGSLGDDSW